MAIRLRTFGRAFRRAPHIPHHQGIGFARTNLIPIVGAAQSIPKYPSSRFFTVSHTSAPTSTSDNPRKPRHLLSIADLSSAELLSLIKVSLNAKSALKTDGMLPSSIVGSLKSSTVAMMFSKRSTRTRVSTEAAVSYLGGHPMFLGRDDIQLGVNESLYDTSKVISSMCSCIVARVGPHDDITALAAASSVPVINALSDLFHPLQAIADMITVCERESGLPEDLSSIKIAWVGDSNNVLYDLLFACAKLGINISVATPSARPVPKDIINTAIAIAQEGHRSKLEFTNEPRAAVKDANVIVTDTWVSMGQEKEQALRMEQFSGFQVTSELAQSGGAKENWKFMHCLPRKPEEVSDEVFYGPNSLVFQEAENRLYAAIATIHAFTVMKGRILYK